jgi:hypothetical protein
MKPTIIVDFDGVIHSYTSGWHSRGGGASVVSDPPVPGAMDFLSTAVDHYTVAILSSRSHQEGGIKAMQAYIWYCLVEELGRERGDKVFEQLQFPLEKPPATLTIDDRAFCFKGTFPTMEEIESFKPWNKL